MSIVNEKQRQEACINLNGVSHFASMLARRRGQNQELAAIAGLLHNYYFCKTGVSDFPGFNSADTVRPLLRELNIFSEEELTTILRAIFYYEDRSVVHGPYEEIVKDAYVLQFYFQDTDCVLKWEDARRLRNVFRELAIPEEDIVEARNSDKSKVLSEVSQPVDKRSKLADIAETLGREHVIGVPGDKRYREICKYWPDLGIYKVLQNNWCAAFVYYCCMQAGFRLPIRYPNACYRLGGVGALLEWHSYRIMNFFILMGKRGLHLSVAIS